MPEMLAHEIHRDPKQPRARIVALGSIAPPMLERAHERLSRQIVSQIRRNTAPQVPVHRVEMALEDHNERARIRPRGAQRLAIARLTHPTSHCRSHLAGSPSKRHDTNRILDTDPFTAS